MKGKIILVVALMMVASLPIVHGKMFSKTSLNNPPNPPEINGPTECKIWRSYTYTITITDPDDDPMTKLKVDFGDGTEVLLLASSCCPWPSGAELSVSHKWKRLGDFTVRAKVMDVEGEWSDWGYLNIHVAKVKQPVFKFKTERLLSSLFNHLFSFF